MSSNNISIISL